MRSCPDEEDSKVAVTGAVAAPTVSRGPVEERATHPLAGDALAVARGRRDAKVRASYAASTQLAYAADWAAFRDWCASVSTDTHPVASLPADDVTLATWIGALDALAFSTIRRKLAAVRLAHARLGHPLSRDLPVTEAALRGHRREQRARTPRRQTAATAERVVAMIDALDVRETLPGTPAARRQLRDRALLLVGFDAALRRSELVGIDRAHLTPTRTGYAIRLPHAKGDQEGKGTHVAIARQAGSAYCPVAALETWLADHDPHVSPVFVSLARGRHVAQAGTDRLSAKAVERIVKRAAAAAGLEGAWAGHSLRRGQITSAIEARVPIHQVQAHARHADIGSTLDYVEGRDAADRHPGVVLVASIRARALDTQARDEFEDGPSDRVPPAPRQECSATDETPDDARSSLTSNTTTST